jgi:hypothetical protein
VGTVSRSQTITLGPACNGIWSPLSTAGPAGLPP